MQGTSKYLGNGSRSGGSRRRIVFVSNTDIFFLQYRLAVALAERERGVDVTVVAPDSGHGAEIEEAGFRFVPLPLSRRGMHPLRELRAVLFLARLYRKLEPDLVHHLTIKPVLYGSLAAALLRRPPAVVNAVTGLGFAFTEGGAGTKLRRLIVSLYRVALQKSGSRTIFENPDDMNEFLKLGLVSEAQSTLLPGLGVDCDRFRDTSFPDGVPVVVLACRMLWDKGVGDFVAAAEILAARGIRARFALVGSPDPGNPSCIPESQLRAWDADGIVEWWGHRDDMPRVFADASIVAFPTCYREGVPRVLLEAAASGRPIVATDMPGCREVVRPGETGTLVSPRSPEELADALQEMIESPALRRQLGSNGRKIAELEFSKTRVVREMLDLHESVLASDAPERRGATGTMAPVHT